MRRALDRKDRYRVLARDGFRCIYCGRDWTDGIKLHVDHRVPRSAGGTDDDANLVTACFDCNMGKSDVVLSGTSDSGYETHRRVREKASNLDPADVEVNYHQRTDMTPEAMSEGVVQVLVALLADDDEYRRRLMARPIS